MEQTQQPTPEQLAAARQVADDVAAVHAAEVPPEAWKKEFPDLYRETPDGQWNVPYRRPEYSQAENESNSKKVQEMRANWARVSVERSLRRSSEVPTIRVRDAHGITQEVPAHMEATLARKGAVRPVISGRATRFFTDKNGVSWRRIPGGEWEIDDDNRRCTNRAPFAWEE